MRINPIDTDYATAAPKLAEALVAIPALIAALGADDVQLLADALDGCCDAGYCRGIADAESFLTRKEVVDNAN